MPLNQYGFETADDDAAVGTPQPAELSRPFDSTALELILRKLPKDILDVRDAIEHDEQGNSDQHIVRSRSRQKIVDDLNRAIVAAQHGRRSHENNPFRTADDAENLEALNAKVLRLQQKLADFDAKAAKEKIQPRLDLRSVDEALVKAGTDKFVAIDCKALAFEVEGLPVQKKGQANAAFLAELESAMAATANEVKAVKRQPCTLTEARQHFLPRYARALDDKATLRPAFTRFIGDNDETARRPQPVVPDIDSALHMRLLKQVLLTEADRELVSIAERLGNKMISDDERRERLTELRARRDALEVLHCAAVRAIKAAGGTASFLPRLHNPLAALGIRPDYSEPAKPKKTNVVTVHKPRKK